MLITERRVISQHFFSQNFQTIALNSFQFTKIKFGKKLSDIHLPFVLFSI